MDYKLSDIEMLLFFDYKSLKTNIRIRKRF